MPSISDSIRRLRRTAAGWLQLGARVGIELIYPPRCAFCDHEMLGPADGVLLCSPCRKQLTIEPHTVCPRCAAAVEQPREAAVTSCPRCREKGWRQDAAFRLGSYRDELREAVLRMKHPTGETLASAIARSFCDLRGDAIAAWRPEIVVPIPMHWRRRMSRGANSPEVLGSALARRLVIPCATGALTRCRLTQPQNELPHEDRAENIRGAFRVKDSWDVSEARVLLVDDVMTTGATANEAAHVLREAGAAEVAIAVVARAEGAA